MTSPSAHSGKRKLIKMLRPLFGLLLLGALIAFVDFDQVGAALRRVDPSWVGMALAVIIAGTMVGAVALHLLLNIERRLPFRDFLPVYWTAWAVGLVFPGQVGDMATMASMLRSHALPASITLGRTLADKLVSLLLMVLFALWAIRAQPYFGALLGAGAGGALLVLLLVAMRRRLPLSLFGRGKAVIFLGQALAEAGRFAGAHPVLIAVNVGLTALKICLTGGAYWCMFNAFGLHHAGPLEIAPLVAITSLVAYIPISFNGIGTAEAAGIAVFGSAGMPAAAVLGTYLILRALGLATAWIPAGAWLLLARPHAKTAREDAD